MSTLEKLLEVPQIVGIISSTLFPSSSSFRLLWMTNSFQNFTGNQTFRLITSIQSKVNALYFLPFLRIRHSLANHHCWSQLSFVKVFSPHLKTNQDFSLRMKCREKSASRDGSCRSTSAKPAVNSTRKNIPRLREIKDRLLKTINFISMISLTFM